MAFVEKKMLYNIEQQRSFCEYLNKEFYNEEVKQRYLRYIFMQCTGVYDYYHNWIYQGDIIKAGNNYALIIWDNTEMRFIISTNEKSGFISSLEIKVVGNRFNNPELLDKIK